MTLTSRSDSSGPGAAVAEPDGAAPQPAGSAQMLDRSRQIIAAAFDLLEEAGLEGLTIRAVLNRTGLSRRAFYERFSGKDDLVLAVFEQSIRRAAADYDHRFKAIPDPVERIKLIVQSLVLGRSALGEAAEEGFGDRRGAALSREHLRLAEARPEELQAVLAPLLALISRQLSQGMDEGLVRRCAPERLAALVYNLVATTVHTELLTQQMARRDSASRQQLANDIWDFCRGAISA